MAITTTFYNSYKKTLLDKTIDHTNDTLKVALVLSSYTPNYDTHAFFSDITNEATGTGYTAGGYTLSGKATSQDNTNNLGIFDANNLTNSTTTVNARYLILYKSTGVASTSPLISCIDLGEQFGSSAGDFNITWDADGIINID